MSPFCRTTLLQMASRGGGSVASKKSAANNSLHNANEQMKKYFMHRNPAEVIQANKRRSAQRESEHRVQMALAAAFITAFLATPFLGRRIAQDKEFRERYIPKWYDYTLEKPQQAFTREELHERLVEMQKELHERAIRGEFTPEKLDQMRRHFAGVDPSKDEHGWGKLHPGLDDDEDIEDE